MIERLLPSVVSCEDAREDGLHPGLFPEEAALLSGAVDARLKEFATARGCARAALARLGKAPGPILRGAKNEPLWPAGIVGSITHCRGYRAAAVAWKTQMRSLGIDAEPHEALPARVERRVLVDEEQAWLAQAPAGVHWGRVIFSAKESIYKAWFPPMRRWLGFEDAVVVIDPEAGEFHARLLADCPSELARLHGRFLVAQGLVLTAVTVPA